MGSPISRETFLERARARFNDHYDYSGIVYKSYKTPILIRCHLHPVKLISITPEKHLQTTGGCKFCLRQSRITMLERELLRAPAERPAAAVDPAAGAASPGPGSPNAPNLPISPAPALAPAPGPGPAPSPAPSPSWLTARAGSVQETLRSDRQSRSR